ncbi:hypothetical protein KAK07_02715 [Ideonella sp. 4Y16]|uniref:hypothetical protein n=1 Tax=Ideonella alba TaxID=2824118 RepID=UPI001B384E8D|nr:hypothetical protein [Ideonella alba]MBQ0942242.1 hypothetical protein [Ideonella alba]
MNAPHTEPRPADERKPLIDLKPILMPVLVAVASSVGSLVAYVFTPLKEVVNGMVWEEQAEVLLITQSAHPVEGEALAVDVLVQPRSPVPLSEGVLQITTQPAGLLRPAPENPKRLAQTTKKIDAATKLTQEPLEFIAQASGKAEIKATLTTRSRRAFETVLQVEIARSTGERFPTRRSFTGVWNIDLDGITGTMTLTDVARTLKGSYVLSDGRRGLVEGTRDGKTFRVTFYVEGDSPARYAVDATFDPDDKADLELTGSARLRTPTGNNLEPWKDLRTVTFHGVARAP